MNLPARVWVLAERLYIHIHQPEGFVELLRQYDIKYMSDVYRDWNTVQTRYTFMSEEDYRFASFMQSVPSYKYLKILEHVVFDPDIIKTQRSKWNYYNEFIRDWYPSLLDLLKLSKIEIDTANKKLTLAEEMEEATTEDFLPHPFYDPFLDYLRKEINESYDAGLYLSVMFLTRKVIESIFIRVVEVVFPKILDGQYNAANHEIWYDTKRGSYRDFDRLINVFHDKAAVFHEDKQLILELCDLVRPLKKETNVCVHADYKIPDAEYVSQWRIPYVINLARKVFRKYCNP